MRTTAHEPIARFVLLQLAVARGDRTDAAAHVTDLVTSGHDGVAVRLGEARAALMGGDRATARSALLRATEIDPQRIEPWIGLEAVASSLGDLPLRRNALEHLVALEQHDRTSLRSLVTVLQSEGDHAAIAALAERARFLDSENRALQLVIARALLAEDRAQDALSSLDLALATDAPDARAHVARAEALARLGRAREARAAADEALRLDATLAADVAAALAH